MKTTVLLSLGVAVTLGLTMAACGSDDPVADDTTSSSAETTTSATTSGAGGSNEGGANASSSEAATTSATGSGGAGGAPPCPGLGDACTDCLAWQCSDAYCGCYENASCGTIVQCFSQCPPNDAGCTQDCMSGSPNGIADSFIIGNCSATTCTAECGGAGLALSPCELCLFSKCESQVNTCFATEECFNIIECAAACPPGDSACQQNCALQHPFFDNNVMQLMKAHVHGPNTVSRRHDIWHRRQTAQDAKAAVAKRPKKRDVDFTSRDFDEDVIG